jgi:hypothetical protein
MIDFALDKRERVLEAQAVAPEHDDHRSPAGPRVRHVTAAYTGGV